MEKETLNRQVILINRPAGIPQKKDFKIIESTMPMLAAGQIRVRNIYLSVEPAMRGWVSAVPNYSDPVALNSVMRAFAVGVVDESMHQKFKVGMRVAGLFGWQHYSVVDASDIEQVLDSDDMPISTALGVLGINGVTAHIGLLEVGQPKPGETVVVSTAAGAVGSCVGQIAKIKGCRTVGIAGGAAKVQMCMDMFGYDAAVDYKSEDFSNSLALACKDGIDIYFDNVAGRISDEVMKHLNIGARVVICGTASVASWNPHPMGPRIDRTLLVKRARMQGFLIFDHKDYYPTARRDLREWIRSGAIRYKEDILEGIEAAPDSIAGLYRGENIGKRLIKVLKD